jgi:predicted dehydrogenase
MQKIRVFLAGIGGYGSNYLNEFLDAIDPPFEFVGAADPFAASSPRFAELKERGIPVYNSPAEFFATGNRADLAVIAAPIHTHYPYIVSCFENGNNVLCEKPITGDLTRLDDLIAREEKTSLFCGVGFQNCFSRDTLALKKDILAGVFGKPLEFKSYNLTRRGDKYYSRNNWAGKLVVEGETILDSPLNNACAHELQLMLFLLGNDMNRSGDVVSVDAELWQARPDIENFDAVALRANTAAAVPVLFYTAHCIEIPRAGPVGEYKFERAHIRWGEKPHPGFTAYFNDGSVKSYEELKSENILQKFYDTLDALNTGVPPVCTLKTVRDHLKCVEMVRKFPITKAPKEKLVYQQDKGEAQQGMGYPFYYISGLSEALLRSYRENKLPAETGFAL